MHTVCYRLKCKACNVYRADRQFNFWSRTPCVPGPCVAETVSPETSKHSAFHRQFE